MEMRLRDMTNAAIEPFETRVPQRWSSVDCIYFYGGYLNCVRGSRQWYMLETDNWGSHLARRLKGPKCKDQSYFAYIQVLWMEQVLFLFPFGPYFNRVLWRLNSTVFIKTDLKPSVKFIVFSLDIFVTGGWNRKFWEYLIFKQFKEYGKQNLESSTLH